MEGIVFYWFSWIAWVFSTFFMKKGKKRLILSAAILLFIIGSNHIVRISSISINLTFLLLILFTLSVVSINVRGWTLIYFLISSLIITMGYVGFHLFELFDPVWLLFDRNLMLSVAMVYLTLMLLKDSSHRMMVMIIGVCNGELLYTYILSRFSFPHEIGSFQFLDVMAIMTLLVMFWSILEKVTMIWETHFQARTKGKAG
ncbi:YphA family membrane protein [Bacillus sp. Marseille-P3661]|uniref:YphA family membrane protein n=1 Tax=Bacillus sp. Marseille-P3661 TaxID=1936234 RepID=UPI000C866DEB|nr:hypothetical protein [Bacillus sp. Marseille-P3661]